MSFRNLVPLERHRIIHLRDEGLNISQIAEELNMTRNTVKLWLRRFDSEGHVDSRPRCRRPHILTPDRVEHMVRTYEEQPFTPTRRFASEYECSLRAVRYALRKAGIRHRKPAKKIVLTDAHKEARVRFARDYRDFDFSQAIFSDEKTFKSSQIGRRHLWRVNNTRYEPKNVIPNMESGRVVVNMWGWMSAAGPGELVYISGRATGSSYLEVLQEVMMPTVRVVYPEQEVPEVLFIQDNCPIHKCHLVQN